MGFIKKIIEFFKRTKDVVASTELKINKYIHEHKKQIKLMINLLEMMCPAGAGIKKMGCLVTNVCYAIGLENVSKDVADIVEKECQKIYDDFKNSLN